MEIMTQEHLTSTVEEDIPNLKESIFSSLDDGVLKSFQWGALFLYLLSYFYASSLLEFQTVYLFPLAIGLILFVEYLANKLAHPFFQMEGSGGNLLETRLFLTMTLLQSLALSIWGFHPQMEFFQLCLLCSSPHRQANSRPLGYHGLVRQHSSLSHPALSEFPDRSSGFSAKKFFCRP